MATSALRQTGPVPRRRVKLAGIGQLVTCAGPQRGPLADWSALGSLTGAELVARHNLEGGWEVEWFGPAGATDGPPADATFNLGGRVLLPGLCDAHTHLVFAGDRAGEFSRRLAGASYQAIAAEGGGIAHTVRATRAATVPALVDAAATRLDDLAAQGVRVVEIKTGYGLDLFNELKLAQVIAALRGRFAGRVRIVGTAMPAHAVPEEHKGDPDGWIDRVCGEILPALAATGEFAFADVFVEAGYFDVGQAERVARAARAAGLGLKAHVDEFADIGGLAWAIGACATSVDHLLRTTPTGVAALAASETVAVGLPLTSVFLREPLAPLRALVDAGALVALATDCNPGSSMSTSLTLCLQLAVQLGRLTPAEAIRAATRTAARALGNPGGYSGRIAVGEPFVPTVLEVPHLDAVFYHLGRPAVAWHGLRAAGIGW